MVFKTLNCFLSHLKCKEYGSNFAKPELQGILPSYQSLWQLSVFILAKSAIFNQYLVVLLSFITSNIAL